MSLSSAFNPIARLRGRAHVLANAEGELHQFLPLDRLLRLWKADKVKNEITACVEEIHDILEHKSKRPLSTFLTEVDFGDLPVPFFLALTGDSGQVTSYRSILRIYCERGEEHELRAYVAVRQNRRPYLRYIATEASRAVVRRSIGP